METIPISEIQQNLPDYLLRVRAGEVILITENNRPVAELKPVESIVHDRRPSGLCEGEFRTPDDFNNPLPADILKEFDGQ